MSKLRAYVYTPALERQGPVKRFDSLSWAKVANGIGRWELSAPYDPDLDFAPDCTIIAIWRTPTGRGVRYKYLEFVGLSTRYRRQRVSRTEERIVVSGTCLNGLLNTRVVNLDDPAAGTIANLPVDDAMKKVVRQHLGSEAQGDRALPSSIFKVLPNTSLGPKITQKIEYRSTWDALQDLWEYSKSQGQEVFFEVRAIESENLSFEFVTAVGQLGSDRRQLGRLSVADGTLREAEVDVNYEGSATVVYHRKPTGQSTARPQIDLWRFGSPAVNAQLEDGTIIPLMAGMRERFVSTRGQETDAQREVAAKAAAEKYAPRRIFTAAIVEKPGFRYGEHWRYGDTVEAAEFGGVYRGQIRAVQVTRDGQGREIVDARIGSTAGAETEIGYITGRLWSDFDQDFAYSPDKLDRDGNPSDVGLDMLVDLFTARDTETFDPSAETIVASTRTNTNSLDNTLEESGRFELAVPPGTYWLRAGTVAEVDPTAIPILPTTTLVTVVVGQTIDLNYPWRPVFNWWVGG